MKALTSVRYSGELTGENGPVELDVRATSDSDCTGSVVVGGGRVEVLVKDGTNWFRPDGAFWRAPAPDQADAIIAAVGDKWVVDSLARFTRFCDLEQFFDNSFPDAGEDGVVYVKAGTDELDGQDVVRIRNRAEGGTSTGYVLVDEPHLLLRVERTEGDRPARVEFSDFDEAFDVEAPAADGVADLSGQ